MSTFAESIEIAVDPQRLASYLTDVRNLPEYMPRLPKVEVHEGEDGRSSGTVTVTARPRIDAQGTQVEVTGTAWYQIVDQGRKMTWGSEGGRHNYSGEFEVEDLGAGRSRLHVRLATERAGGQPVDAGLRDTLDKIKGIAEAWATADLLDSDLG